MFRALRAGLIRAVGPWLSFGFYQTLSVSGLWQLDFRSHKDVGDVTLHHAEF